MQALIEAVHTVDNSRYAKCVENSKRMRFDIDRDVIRGRTFDFTQKFLPDGLSKADQMGFLSEPERRLLSQIQGRSYANIFGLVERFIAAKVLEVSRHHWLGDQTALEALVRFGDEELKHQELFRRIERMVAAGMPEGYTFLPEPNAVAMAVLGKSTWAVLALICHIELFVLAHYRESIDRDPSLSELWKDVFLHHWREESQHAILDELEWARENARVTPEQRDRAVNELIELVAAIDAIRPPMRIISCESAGARSITTTRSKYVPAFCRHTAGNTSCRACRAGSAKYSVATSLQASMSASATRSRRSWAEHRVR